MKRIITMSLALLLLLALCACGGNGAPTEAAVEPTTQAEPPAEAPAEPAAPAPEIPEAPAVPDAPADEQETAPSGDPTQEPPAKPEESASGEASSDAPENVEVQDFSVFPMDGYPKTFDGYIDWVCAALESQTGNPNLESEIATVRATTEDAYNPDAMPFSMQIRFGLICSYEDFLLG